jgi:predicted nucleotidyltransferase
MDIAAMRFQPDEPRLAAVEAIVLFGSRSRGDADAHSDADYAAFVDVSAPEEMIRVKRFMLDKQNDPRLNVSLYSKATANQMKAGGSLFLWHLKLEGCVQYRRSDWIDGLMVNLAPYSPARAQADLATLKVVLRDIQQSLRKDGLTLVFEVSTLFSVARTMGMIHTTLIGRPAFGRVEPILQLNRLAVEQDQLTVTELEALVSARMIYTRKDPESGFSMDRSKSLRLWGKVFGLLTAVEEAIREPVRAHT